MIRVLLCIGQEHDPRLVLLAVLVCLGGSAASVQLFGRVRAVQGPARLGWISLAAVATGTTVWCTHFVAMLAFEPPVSVVVEPILTFASLLVAILASAAGLTLAARRGTRWAPAAGGAVVGLAVAAMHYLGMAAYRVDGLVRWDIGFVLASVLLSVTLSATAFHVLAKPVRGANAIGALVFGLAVATLHFTGMAGMTIVAFKLHGEGGLSDATMTAMAIATAMAALLVVGCAAVSALIDEHMRSDTYRRLRRMALHDGLTDLPNRLSFNEELSRRLQMTGGAGRLAVVMLDLSRFKTVNDTYGHQAGDQLLVALAARFGRVLRGGECVARLGGDEFAALCSHDDPDALAGFLARLSGEFAEPFVFERFSATLASNIGVALAPFDGQDADTLLAKADLAMYRAKTAHSAKPCFYRADMDEGVRDRREMAADLRRAVAAGAFELHYQVQAAVATGEISGYEVLTRWSHPTRGAVPPSVFVPLAEEIGEIIPLSNWILRQACFEAALWPHRAPIAVNLSPLQLSDPGLVATVRAALADSGLSPGRLALELTESAIIRDRAYALAQLRQLKAMGIGLALDDFGVGYSSIDVLRSFPFDRLKLDASFVAEIERDAQAVSILRSVASLGASLHIPILAEGIETPGQLAICAQEGCATIQGYLIGRPARALAHPDAVRRAMLGSTGATALRVVA